jgi:hypothetical protein
MSGSGYVIFFICLLALLAMVLLWAGIYFAHSFLTVVGQSAAGSDEVTWPDEPFTDWLWEGGYFWAVLAVWPGAAWLAARQLPGSFGPVALAALAAVVLALLFPLSLLSSLSSTSPLVLVRWQLLRRLVRRWDGFLVFTVLSPVFPIAITLANYWILFGRDSHAPPGSLVITIPAVAFLSVFLLLLYARMIGRLGWLIRPRRVPRSVTKPAPLPIAGAGEEESRPRRPEPRPAPRKREPREEGDTFGFQDDEPAPQAVPKLPDATPANESDEEDEEDESSPEMDVAEDRRVKPWSLVFDFRVVFFPFSPGCLAPLAWLTVGWGLVLLLVIGARALYTDQIAPRLTEEVRVSPGGMRQAAAASLGMGKREKVDHFLRGIIACGSAMGTSFTRGTPPAAMTGSSWIEYSWSLPRKLIWPE